MGGRVGRARRRALGIGAVRAAGDAFERNHADCWFLGESVEDVDVMGCAPGHRPVAGSPDDPDADSVSSRACGLVDESASTGATRWRCRTDRHLTLHAVIGVRAR